MSLRTSTDWDWLVISARLATYVVLALILAGPLREFGKGLQALASIIGRMEGWVCW